MNNNPQKSNFLTSELKKEAKTYWNMNSSSPSRSKYDSPENFIIDKLLDYVSRFFFKSKS